MASQKQLIGMQVAGLHVSHAGASIVSDKTVRPEMLRQMIRNDSVVLVEIIAIIFMPNVSRARGTILS